MNKKPDKTATQEIYLPQSRTDYGDNFDESPLRNDTKRKKGKPKLAFYKKISKKQLIIISSCVLVVIIVIGIIVISLSSSKVEKKQETTISSTTSTIKEEKKYTTSINNNYYNEDSQSKYSYTEGSTTQAPSTEIATTMQPTTQVTETSKQIETTDPPTVSFETEAQTATYMEKILSVDDISVIKTDDNLFICTANGTFDGYSDEELLNLVSISSTSGAPIISSPSLNDSTFSFYIGLSDECDGELCIHFGNYDYYQPISSMS